MVIIFGLEEDGAHGKARPVCLNIKAAAGIGAGHDQQSREEFLFKLIEEVLVFWQPESLEEVPFKVGTKLAREWLVDL